MRTLLAALLGGILGATLVSFITFAWTGPTGTAPSANVSAPINVGTSDQVKNAGLSVNALAVFGNAILSGTSRYLNFGTAAGSSGYGIRDNSGTMEFKNSSGSWQALLSTDSTFSQIKFSDGTTQTTAASGGITSCRVCTRFQYEWYGYKWSSQGCSPYSSGNIPQTAQSGKGYGYVVQVETSIQCQ